VTQSFPNHVKLLLIFFEPLLVNHKLLTNAQNLKAFQNILIFYLTLPFSKYKVLIGLPGFARDFYCQLSISVSLFLCLSISLSLCFYASLSLCLFVFMPLYLSIYLCLTPLSISLSLCFYASLSLSISLSLPSISLLSLYLR
jgi:hypothetical protein